jgi:1-phosphatidylinositol-4-phosphate 5-kinase
MMRTKNLTGSNSDTELLMVLDLFKGITQGHREMNKEQFLEFLQSLNLYPNLKVGFRIFEVLDEDKDGKINFQTFISYMFFLLSGNLKEKIKFIFKMIS